MVTINIKLELNLDVNEYCYYEGCSNDAGCIICSVSPRRYYILFCTSEEDSNEEQYIMCRSCFKDNRKILNDIPYTDRNIDEYENKDFPFDHDTTIIGHED